MLPEVIYYVAMSVDGYISTFDGGVEWLEEFERGDEDYGYADFFASVDALIMGSGTYQKILDFGEWPYIGKPCYVLTRKILPESFENVFQTRQNPDEVLGQMYTQGIRRVWFVGGARSAYAFQEAGLITEYFITVVPILLGAGLPLIETEHEDPETLQLLSVKHFKDGVVQLRYRLESRD